MNGREKTAERGFSLVEVMVALVICAIGLLGLAKMESLGLASTTVSSLRSLVALEAAGMAASMHADRGYWASTNATAGSTITGSAPTVTLTGSTTTDPVLGVTGAAGTCAATAACSPSAMAARDVQAWGQTISGIPGYTATIACTPTATPVTCTISVTWLESAVAVNAQQTGITQGNFTAAQQPTYTLYVQP
jgi:type IV pilus assembly protein PilV